MIIKFGYVTKFYIGCAMFVYRRTIFGVQIISIENCMRWVVLLLLFLGLRGDRYCFEAQNGCQVQGIVCGLGEDNAFYATFENECSACSNVDVFRVVDGACVDDNIAPNDKGNINVTNLYNDGAN